MRFFLSSMLFLESIGGGETLFIRMSRWMRDMGYIPCLLLDESISISPKLFSTIECEKINIIKLSKKGFSIEISQCGIAKEIKKESSEILAVSYTLMQKELCDMVFARYKEYKGIIYNINWGDSFILKGKLLGRYVMRSYVKSLLESNSYYCMDTVCRDMVASFTRIDKYNIPIALLGVDQNVSYTPRKRNAKISVLTICRMDFPFKGYVLGLIDDFSKLCKKNDIYLTIVGDGAGFKYVEKKISCLDKAIAERITLIPMVPYQKLKDLYSVADVYVGMGTTLLEASKYSIPAIVADAYQYDNFSPGFFDETESFGYPISGQFSMYVNEQEAKKNTFYELIQSVIEMPDIDYSSLCEKTYFNFVEKNSMDSMMQIMLKDCRKKTHRYGMNVVLSLYKRGKLLFDFQRRKRAST